LDDFSRYYDLALQFYSRGDYEQAFPYFEQSLSLTNPGDIHTLSLYYKYCRCLYIMGEFSQALLKAEQGLSFYPDCRELFYIRGQIYFEIGLLHESKTNFTKCASLKTHFKEWSDNDNDRIENYKIYWYLSAISAYLGNTEEALHYFNNIALENPVLPVLKSLACILINTGIDKKILINSLYEKNTISSTSLIYFLLAIEAYEECRQTIEHIGLNQELYPAWVHSQLYLGRYKEIQSLFASLGPNIQLNGDLIIYYCISQWLEFPRQSVRVFLEKMNHDNPLVVNVCLWIDNILFSQDTLGNKNKNYNTLITEIALIIYKLGDIGLALDIVSRYFAGENKEAYAKLGRAAFARGYYQEARTLLERSLSSQGIDTLDYYKLGVACARLGCYEQAIEYFLKAMVTQPDNPVIPCLIYEAITKQSMKLLVAGCKFPEANQELKSELIRLGSINRQAKRLRQTYNKQTAKTGLAINLDDSLEEYSLGNDSKQEEAWKLNV